MVGGGIGVPLGYDLVGGVLPDSPSQMGGTGVLFGYDLVQKKWRAIPGENLVGLPCQVELAGG